MKTRSLVLLIAFLMGAQVRAAEQIVHRSFCRLTSPQTHKQVRCYADVIRETENQTTELRIYIENGTSGERYIHRLEEGQEFVSSIGSMFLPEVGRVFFVEWEWGARTIGLTLYKLGSDGRLKEFFRDGGVDGYRVAELSNDNAPKLIIFDKDEGRNEHVARIYTVTTSGDFQAPAVVRSKRPFVFDLK